MSKNFIWLFIALCLLVTLTVVSANGLTLVNTSTFTLNKTEGQTPNITFILRNEEPFTFYNITTEDNSKIQMSKISSLASGSNITVTANVTSVSDFNGVVRIKGFYSSNLAELNENHFVSVNYDTGLTACDMSITKGDSITWFNEINTTNGVIKVINSDTHAEVASIDPQTNYTEVFTSPLTFNYYFTRLGLQFTETCHIAVLDTQGYINDPTLDALLTLNLDVLFIPTTLNLESFDNSYTIIAGTSAQDVLRVTNVGNNTARGIHLNGEWFIFSSNDFDLGPGLSKNVPYTITPAIQNVNDTNKTYTKILSVEGNFDSVNKSYSIFIPYSDIGNFSSSSGQDIYELFKDRAAFVKSYCNSLPPDDPVCRDLFKSGSGNNSADQNQTGVTSQQFFEFVKGFIEWMDKQDKENNVQKEQNLNISDRLTSLENVTTVIQSDVTEIKTKSNNNESSTILVGATFITLVLLLILGFIIIRKKRERAFNEIERYT